MKSNLNVITTVMAIATAEMSSVVDGHAAFVGFFLVFFGFYALSIYFAVLPVV